MRQKGPNVIPIIGARKASQVEDSMGCIGWQLSEEHMKLLDEISEIPLGFPHEFLKTENVNNYAFGGWRDKLDL
ncbi:hypothetical protein V6R21_20470 [Limibacter armeniacum]